MSFITILGENVGTLLNPFKLTRYQVVTVTKPERYAKNYNVLTFHRFISHKPRVQNMSYKLNINTNIIYTTKKLLTG